MEEGGDLESTGLRCLTTHFCEDFAVDYCVAIDLEQREAICTGRAVIHLDEKHGKGDAAREIVKATGAEYVIALGDSRGDLGMFGVADYSIAIGKAHSSVVETADAHFLNPDLGVVAEAIAARDYLI